MGRELRRVPAGWNPGPDANPHFDNDFDSAIREWFAEYDAWDPTENESGREMSYVDWAGGPPDPKYYRPKWSDEERTHFMYYSNVSEGSPLSPPCESIDELARWLADNREFGAAQYPSIFPVRTYDEWFSLLTTMAESGLSSPTFMVTNGNLQDGATWLQQRETP